MGYGVWGVLSLAALLAGCANPNFLPPGSRPVAAVRTYPQGALERNLAGSWRVLRRQQPPQTAYGANLLQRAAEVQNVTGWAAMNFLPTPRPVSEAHPGVLVLSSGKHSIRLSYWIEGNLVAIAPSGNRRTAHSHWEAVAGPKTLLLRSLEDGEVLTMARESGAR